MPPRCLERRSWSFANWRQERRMVVMRRNTQNPASHCSLLSRLSRLWLYLNIVRPIRATRKRAKTRKDKV